MLLSQVISKDLSLSQEGSSRYVALCPWHKDSTPSLQIHNGKNLFKCFVCGMGGKGAASYIMKTRNVSYKDAVELLKTNYDTIDYEEIQNEIEEIIKKNIPNYQYGLRRKDQTEIFLENNWEVQYKEFDFNFEFEKNSF